MSNKIRMFRDSTKLGEDQIAAGRGAGVASPHEPVKRVVAERLVLADDVEVREPLVLDCEVRITHRIALGAAGGHHPGQRPSSCSPAPTSCCPAGSSSPSPA